MCLLHSASRAHYEAAHCQQMQIVCQRLHKRKFWTHTYRIMQALARTFLSWRTPFPPVFHGCSRRVGWQPSAPNACAPVSSPCTALQGKTKIGGAVFERFHICPFVMRERMDTDPDARRPVYRYVFLCSGEAEALVSATAQCLRLCVKCSHRTWRSIVTWILWIP